MRDIYQEGRTSEVLFIYWLKHLRVLWKINNIKNCMLIFSSMVLISHLKLVDLDPDKPNITNTVTPKMNQTKPSFLSYKGHSWSILNVFSTRSYTKLQYNYPSFISDLGNFYRPLSSTMGWELADISDILLSFATKLKRLRNIANKKLSVTKNGLKPVFVVAVVVIVVLRLVCCCFLDFLLF